MNSKTRTFAGPLVGLGVILALATIHQLALMLLGGEASKQSGNLYNYSYSFLVAWGVELDRKATGMAAPFEYAAFMFFLWVVMLPIYLFRTRRWRGLAIAISVV